jgi:predicted membrane channel-forming protein YqfA (hemolysin III family)
MGEQVVMLDGLLIGIIVSLALTASLFFLKFWRAARDPLFIAFAIVFAVEGLTRVYTLFAKLPTDHSFLVNAVRMAAYLFLIATIAFKNRKSKP